MSPTTSLDPSIAGANDGRCAWCRCELASTARGARFCSKTCRQTAFRLRRRAAELSLLEEFDASTRSSGDASLSPAVDASPLSGVDGSRRCAHCQRKIDGRSDAIYCSKKCRQVAFLARRRREVELRGQRSMRFVYADPPYPGLASYYKGEPTYAGEVDHVELVGRLRAANLDGWALSTSSDALRFVLPLCPPEARVTSWSKPHCVPAATRGLHSAWEPLIVVGGRRRRPGVRDFIVAHAARGGGTLIGRKPLAFVAFLFACLGMRPGDELEDLYPGTGIVQRAWRELGGRVVQDLARPVAHASR